MNGRINERSHEKKGSTETKPKKKKETKVGHQK
eukprot:SAG11_NODE_6020_length_1407_cov_6.711009_2_plen_33_part_00